ncbi:MAG TPA: FG-GAP repeat protein [Solirubrobacteraceae bacterium]
MAVAACTVLAALSLPSASPRTVPAVHAAVLPVAAVGPVSAAVGRVDRAYWVHGTRATNPVQNLRIGFSPAGVSVRNGAGSVALSLIGFGRSGAVRQVGHVTPLARANRVLYAFPGIRAWYANGPAGLEQGFDVARAPSGDSGRLVFSMALAGSLRARMAGDSVMLGGSLRYTGLVAVDARGRRLPASMQLRGDRLALTVDDRGARYPLRVDPFVQAAELTASSPSTQIALGYSSAISGSTIVVGAPAATVGAAASQGDVLVFTEPSSGWASTSTAAVLTASDGAAHDSLGFSVAIDGTTIVAGAPAHNGVGAAYVYTEPSNGTWTSATQTAELTPTGAQNGYLPVAVSGSTIAIGRGFQAGSHSQQGAVDVFVKPAGAWANSSTPAVLTAADGVAQSVLGVTVAISPSTVSPTTIAAGAQTGGGSGSAVYVFSQPSGGWATTSTPSAELQVGTSSIFGGEPQLADSGSTIAVGNATATVGSNAQQGNVSIFSEPTTGWANAPSPSATLTAASGGAGDDMGFTVSASGTTIVAGAPSAGSGQGAVYVFDQPATGWATTGTPAQVLTNSPAGPAGELGYSVGISGGTVIAGTRAHDLGEFVFDIPGSGGGGGAGGAGATAPPVATTRPVVSGTAKAGHTLSCSPGSWSNSPTRYAYQWSRDGTPILGATNATYKVQKSDEQLMLACTVTASNAKGAGPAAASARKIVPVPKVKGCPSATGSLSGVKLGLVKLGMTRAAAHKAFKHSSNRGEKYEDFFCLTPIGIRVGYGSAAVPKRFRDKVIWASTSSAYYTVKGVRAGATVTAAAKTLTLSRPFKVGRNTWYFAPEADTNAIFKVRGGVIEEIGIALKSRTSTPAAKRKFLKSFS